MRFAFRFLIPLLVLLALIAWGASLVATRSARAWAERDLRARARLVLSGSRETLERSIRAADRAGSRALLDALVRDERLIAASVCDGKLDALAAVGDLPAQARCEDRKATRAELADGLDENVPMPGGEVHVSWIPVGNEGAALGYLVLVHDLSFVDRRASTTRRALFVAFGLVGFAAAVATLLTARFSRRSWAAELRKVLPGILSGGRAQGGLSRDFGPVVSDVRELVASLATEEATHGGRWTAERLRRVLERNLGGEGVVVVANREPYMHVRGEDGLVRVQFSGERARHRAGAGHAGLLRHLDRPRQRLGGPGGGGSERPGARPPGRGLLHAPSCLARSGGGARLLLRLLERGALAALPPGRRQARVPGRGLGPLPGGQPEVRPRPSATRSRARIPSCWCRTTTSPCSPG